jgi:hypothetical protein
MFFKHKPTDFVLIQRDKLALYPKGKVPQLDLSEELVQYLEIQDAQRLRASVAEFAQANRLGGRRVLIMLDRSVVFQKAVNLKDQVDPEASKADFESKVPFDPADKQVLEVQQKDRQFLFGVNKTLYATVKAALEQSGAKVQAVVPAIVYGITDPDKLTSTKLEQIADAASLTHAVDLLATS